MKGSYSFLFEAAIIKLAQTGVIFQKIVTLFFPIFLHFIGHFSFNLKYVFVKFKIKNLMTEYAFTVALKCLTKTLMNWQVLLILMFF